MSCEWIIQACPLKLPRLLIYIHLLMFLFHMLRQTALICKLFVTMITSIFDSFMYRLNMFFQITLLSSLKVTMITIILDSFMYRFDMSMFGQTILSSKSMFTLITSILDSVLYRENMCIQMRILWKAFSHWWQSFIATKRNSQFFHPLLWKVRFT